VSLIKPHFKYIWKCHSENHPVQLIKNSKKPYNKKSGNLMIPRLINSVAIVGLMSAFLK
jgi:hypothetical protein